MRDHFPASTPDLAIFAFMSTREDCFLLTRDDKIRRHPHEVAAFQAAGIGAFILTGRAQKTVIETMSFICDCLPEMEQWAIRTQRPFVCGISDRKRFELL